MKTVRFVLALLALALVAPLQSAKAADVICYNCPPEWADWASMLKAVKATSTTISRTTTRIRAGAGADPGREEQSGRRYRLFRRHLRHEGQGPDALEPYKPPIGTRCRRLKDPTATGPPSIPARSSVRQQGCARGKPVPACWKDLLKPDYKGMVGYLDPSSAAVGYVGAVAINLALGGSAANFDPAISFFKELRKNDRSSPSRPPTPA